MKSIGMHRAVQLAQKAAAGLGLDSRQARPHTVILAAKLNSNKESYRMSLEHKVQRDILNWAQGLEDRDAFVAVAHGLGFAKVPVIGDVEYQTAAELAFAPDARLFSTAAGTATLSEKQALQSIIYGTHTIKTNQGVRIDQHSNLLFETSQTTQHSATTVNERTGLELKEIGAAVNYAGGDDNSVIIDFSCEDKTHIAGAIASGDGHANYLIYVAVGAIIKGGTTKVYTR